MATRHTIGRLCDRIDRIAQRYGVIHQPVLVWREQGETHVAAIERHLAARPKDRARRIIVVGWRG